MTTQQPSTDDPRTLLARMMQKELFVVLNKALVEPAALQPYLLAHLHYVIDLEKRGVLFASGPFSDAAGRLTGAGDHGQLGVGRADVRALRRDPGRHHHPPDRPPLLR